MAEKMVRCAKLGQELPGLDENTPEGRSALKYCLVVGGAELRDRVRDHVSAEAWKQWTDYQVMVVNEYRLDPMSDQSNAILKTHMESFFFGQQTAIPNWTPTTP